MCAVDKRETEKLVYVLLIQQLFDKLRLKHNQIYVAIVILSSYLFVADGFPVRLVKTFGSSSLSTKGDRR